MHLHADTLHCVLDVSISDCGPFLEVKKEKTADFYLRSLGGSWKIFLPLYKDRRARERPCSSVVEIKLNLHCSHQIHSSFY